MKRFIVLVLFVIPVISQAALNSRVLFIAPLELQDTLQTVYPGGGWDVPLANSENDTTHVLVNWGGVDSNTVIALSELGVYCFFLDGLLDCEASEPFCDTSRTYTVAEAIDSLGLHKLELELGE